MGEVPARHGGPCCQTGIKISRKSPVSVFSGEPSNGWVPRVSTTMAGAWQNINKAGRWLSGYVLRLLVSRIALLAVISLLIVAALALPLQERQTWTGRYSFELWDDRCKPIILSSAREPSPREHSMSWLVRTKEKETPLHSRLATDRGGIVFSRAGCI